MHICYVADARSPIAQSWISHFVTRGDRVTVISSYPCSTDEIPGARIVQFPFALSSFSGAQVRRGSSHPGTRSRVAAALQGARISRACHALRAHMAPAEIRRKRRALGQLIDRLRPDLVHAMRLPYEGLLAASATDLPLLISVWGNDFTLFADRYGGVGELTNRALRRADGLHCDCHRDMRLAFARGFPRQRPWQVLPGSGGIQRVMCINREPDYLYLRRLGIPEGSPLIINPRGFRTYVRNDTFFRAIPLVLKEVPEAFFVATAMSGNAVAERWIRRLGISTSVRLLPTVSRNQLADLFSASLISVSPSFHDGTPNTLLEAMACGCLPVVGNVESVGEWITNGTNGLVCDVSDEHSLAGCILRGLRDPELRLEAARLNRNLVRSRADYAHCMLEAEKLYREVVSQRRGPAISSLKLEQEHTYTSSSGAR